MECCHVCWLDLSAQPSPVAAQLSPKRSKVHRRPPAQGCSVAGPWNVVSPAQPFPLLCYACWVRPMIVVQRARRGRKRCTLKCSARRACEPESSLVGRGRTLLPLIPTRTKRRGLCSARLLASALPFTQTPSSSPKRPHHSESTHSTRKKHHLHSKGPSQIFRTILRFGSATRACTDWTSNPKRVQLHAFNCLPSWMGNIYLHLVVASSVATHLC